MRKLIVIENVSLDGVMEAPQQWAFTYQNEEIAAFNKAGMSPTNTLLLGRVTYTEMASFWPMQTNNAMGIADYINNVAKIVVSSSLEKADWHNTTVIRGNLTAEINKLKQQSGGNIVVLGSGQLVQSLMQANLVDEYQLSLIPLVLGQGKQLFRAGVTAQKLQLIEAKPFSTGVMLMRYQPTPK